MSFKEQIVEKTHNVDAKWAWVGVALLAHTGWGAYPVLGRYLQTVSNLPSLSLLAAGQFLPLLLLVFLFRKKLDRRIFQAKLLWAFALIVVVRAVTNMLASRYTLSIYVQLITQSTPFLVVLLGATLFRERIPRYTGWAISLCLLGALLMMGDDIGRIDLSAGTSRSDWLGIGLALASSLSLAFYMLVVRRTATDNVPAEAVLVVQAATVMLVTLVASTVIGENWNRWLEIGPIDWLVFLAMSLGVLAMSNIGQVVALRHIGAPYVSSIMAWRLVSALILGALLLGERLDSGWQLLGAGIVLVTITWYLSRQRQQEPA